MTFGEKLKNARKLKGLTQRQLADSIDAKHNSISDWENDKNKPDPDSIEMICGILEITPNYLLNVTESIEFSPYEKEMIEKYRNTDTYGQEMVDIVLSKEYDRTQEQKTQRMQSAIDFPKPSTRLFTYYQRMASAGSGITLFEDMVKTTLEVQDTPTTEKADFIVGVNGDSMSPTFCDGDKLLIAKQENIEVGEIGVFIINNESFVKELGDGELISHNKEYPNVTLREFCSAECVGKVIGKL